MYTTTWMISREFCYMRKANPKVSILYDWFHLYNIFLKWHRNGELIIGWQRLGAWGGRKEERRIVIKEQHEWYPWYWKCTLSWPLCIYPRCDNVLQYVLHTIAALYYSCKMFWVKCAKGLISYNCMWIYKLSLKNTKRK